MKILVEINTAKENEEKYTTYFYHKYNKFVYKITHGGGAGNCVASLRKEYDINSGMLSNSKLPKYIEKLL